jgi:hypothetical protein
VLYAAAMSAGKDKLDARWKEGVRLGLRMESGESLIGTNEGVVKARDFRRKAENGGRWSVVHFDKFVGVPWEPYPGAKGGFELRSTVRLPAEGAEFTETVKGKSDYTRRSFRMRREDLEKYGYTAGCPGYRAVNRGTTSANRSEECRKRLAEKLEKVGDERLVRETERMFEYLEEDENKKKKENMSDDKGESMPSASSSGPALAQGAVPRSRGRVPMATDSGDSAQETVKRKAEDVEQEAGMKDKKNKTGKEEERGAKRSVVDDWEDFAKRLKTNAEESRGKQESRRRYGHQSVPCCKRDWSSIDE